MSEAPKDIVRAGYDACGGRYSAARAEEPAPEVERLLALIPHGGRVLDVGCGAGVPVTAALARTCEVVGVDVSPAQIERARDNVPGATFVCDDIMSAEFEPASFAAVVAFYALFHLPRGEHRPLLERIAGWLCPGGHLLVTVAYSGHPGYTEPDFFGAKMYWSHFEPSWYASALRELGFELLEQGVLGHGYDDDPGRRPERHPLILARKAA